MRLPFRHSAITPTKPDSLTCQAMGAEILHSLVGKQQRWLDSIQFCNLGDDGGVSGIVGGLGCVGNFDTFTHGGV